MDNKTSRKVTTYRALGSDGRKLRATTNTPLVDPQTKQEYFVSYGWYKGQFAMFSTFAKDMTISDIAEELEIISETRFAMKPGQEGRYLDHYDYVTSSIVYKLNGKVIHQSSRTEEIPYPYHR